MKNLFWQDIFEISDWLKAQIDQHIDRKASEEFRSLSLNQLNVVTQVRKATYDSNQELSLKKLAGKLKISPATASELVDSLVKKGFLDRRQNPNDRRAICITLSAETEQIFSHCRTKLIELTTSLMKNLPSEEAEELIRLTQKFKKIIQEQ